MSISNFCASEAIKICGKCGDGIGFEDVLKVQNLTLQSLKESEAKVALIETQIANVTAKLVGNLTLTESALIKVRKYDDILHQTEQILYW